MRAEAYCLFVRAIGSGEGLGTDAGRLRRKEDAYGSLLDGDIPLVAGDVPIQLVMVLEKFQAVPDKVFQHEGAGGICGAGNPDPEVPVMPLPAAFEFERGALLVRHGDAIQKQSVVEPLRSTIFHGNQPLDTVPGAFEARADGFRHEQLAAGQHLQLHIETTQHKGTRISRQEAHGFNEAQEDQAGENVDEMWTSSGFHDRIAGTIHARTAPVAAHAGWFRLTRKTGGRQS